MIPKVAKSGHSFKGAAAYYLHDKTEDNAFNQASGAKSQTSDRVDWTETRNLASDNPETAWRVMAATAMNAENIKRQNREAEGKRSQSSGQTNSASVYAYSLAWSPEEKGRITREEMTAAAEDTLKQLGFEKHQAMFIAHNDTDHPHIHVLVNKVDPETGRTRNPHRDFNKLDKWARDYRKDRGEEHLCPNREQKWKNHEEGISNKNREKQTNAKLEKGQSKTLHDNDPYAKRTRENLAKRGNRISEIGKRQKARHGKEWENFKAQGKAKRSAIYKKYKRPMSEAKDRLEQAKFHKSAIYDKFKAINAQQREMVYQSYGQARSTLGRTQWKEKRAWEAREATLSGKMVNAIAAARFYGKTEHSRGFIKDAAMMLKAKDQRAAAIVSIHRIQSDKLAKQIKTAQNAISRDVRTARDQELQPHKEAYDSARADMDALANHRKGELVMQKIENKLKHDQLRMNHGSDNQRLRDLWGALKAQRQNAILKLRATLARKAEQSKAHSQSMKANFKEKAEKEAQQKTRNRNRSKERKPRSRGRSYRYKPE